MIENNELTKNCINCIIETLRSLKNELKNNFSVISIGLVGSYARNEQTDNSDVDLVVEFRKVSFNNLAGLSIYLEKIPGQKADIIIKGPYLRKKFIDSVEKEAIYA
jgi:predicted nucleotidyltransferase